MTPIEVLDKLKQIRALLLDVDGVLTDGNIIYNESGDEIKIFNVRDGLGLKLLMSAGIPVGIVTGRKSKALHYRCKDLGIQYVFDAVADKASVVEKIATRLGVSAENIAFIGDDLPDLSLMKQVGLSIAVADAHELVRRQANWITAAGGGCGAVREVCEALLDAQGFWEKIAERF